MYSVHFDSIEIQWNVPDIRCWTSDATRTKHMLCNLKRPRVAALVLLFKNVERCVSHRRIVGLALALSFGLREGMKVNALDYNNNHAGHFNNMCLLRCEQSASDEADPIKSG